MYTVTKGHSKIATKTRRGYSTQKIDSPENHREVRKNNDLEQVAEMSSPKPTFHQVNGKQKSNSQRVPTEINPHHEDIVRYISEDWNRVYREYELNKQQPTEGLRGIPVVKYYQDKSTSKPLLQNFKPFDLESWWGQRLYHKLTQNT